MPTYRFAVVQHQEKRPGRCPVCSRKVTRSRTFDQTINPFNVDPETEKPKTRERIQEELRAQAAAWEPDFTHDACRDSAAPQRADAPAPAK